MEQYTNEALGARLPLPPLGRAAPILNRTQTGDKQSSGSGNRHGSLYYMLCTVSGTGQAVAVMLYTSPPTHNMFTFNTLPDPNDELALLCTE